MPSHVPRPTGVVVLVVLQIIGALFTLIAGMGIMFAGMALQSTYRSSLYRTTTTYGPDPGLLTFFGFVLFIVGLFEFVLAWGLWAGRSWARTTSMVLAVIGAVIGVVTIIGTIFYAILLYYLTRPHVKAFFGKAAPVPVSTPVTAPPPAAHVPPPASTPAFVLCPSCRATIPGDAVFCGKCGADLRPRAPAASPPPPAGPRYCASCGASVAPGVRFCPACGGRVA